MKVWRLVSGILSIVLAVIVWSQAGLVSFVNALDETANDTSGGAGLLVAILLLAGGIVSIAVRKGGKGGSIAIFIVFGLAAILALTAGGMYKDLQVWGAWCAVCAILGFIGIFMKKKES